MARSGPRVAHLLAPTVAVAGMLLAPGHCGSQGGGPGRGAPLRLGSLSCTLPVFLLVVGSVLATGRGIVTGLGQFVSYALGMGAVLIAVTLGTALFRGAVVDRLRRLAPHVDRAR